MVWETLHSYLDTQCNTIADLLPAIGKKADKKTVHKLRVSIKKTMACLALTNHLTGHAFKGKKYIRLLKVLHQSVSALRDLQLQQESLNNYTKNSRQRYRLFHLLIKNHYRLAMQQAQAIAGTFPRAFIKALPRQLHKKQGHPAKAALLQQLRTYLQEQYTAIAVPATQVRAEKWHDLRKHIKRLHYQLEIVQPCFEKQQPLQDMLHFTAEAGSQLGAWHDLLALRQFMRERIQLIQSEKMALPPGTDRLLQLLAADTRKQLQQCRRWLQQKPDIELAIS